MPARTSQVTLDPPPPIIPHPFRYHFASRLTRVLAPTIASTQVSPSLPLKAATGAPPAAREADMSLSTLQMRAPAMRSTVARSLDRTRYSPITVAVKLSVSRLASSSTGTPPIVRVISPSADVLT